MQGYLRAVLTSIGVLTVVSATLLPSVHAHIHWYGNDNGEWQEDWIPTYVNVEAWLNPQGLAFNPPPHGEISLQYNPDKDQSIWFQNGPSDWFQTVIATNSSGCAHFNIQVWNFISGWLGYHTQFPLNTCVTLPAIMAWDAGWYINEYETNNVITSVFFELWGFGFQPYSVTIYPPHNWIWIRSNICWCGSNDDTVAFTTAQGTLYYLSDKNLVKEDPPADIGTTEDSNMDYTCFQGAGTMRMSQTYNIIGQQC